MNSKPTAPGILFTLLCFLLPGTVLAQQAPAPLAQGAPPGDLSQVESPAPARAGTFPDDSADHLAWEAWYLDALAELGLAPVARRVEAAGLFHSFSRNISVFLGPGDSPSPALLLAIPLPGPLPAGPELEVADTAAARHQNAAAVLQLVARLAAADLQSPLEIVLLGGEFEDQKGLRTLLSDPARRAYRAAVYLADFGTSYDWPLAAASGTRISPGWYVDATLGSFSRIQVPVGLTGGTLELYRLGLLPENRIGPLLEEEVPAILLGRGAASDGDRSFASPGSDSVLETWYRRRAGALFEAAMFAGTAAALSRETTGENAAAAVGADRDVAAAAAVEWGATVFSLEALIPTAEQIERRIAAVEDLIGALTDQSSIAAQVDWNNLYLLFDFAGQTWYIEDASYLLALSLFFGLAIVLVRILRRQRFMQRRAMQRYWIVVVGLFTGILVSLGIGGAFVEGLLLAIGGERSAIALTDPTVLLVFKLALALFAFVWVSRLLARHVPPESAVVFTGTAFFALVFQVILLVALNLTFAYHSAWTLIFVLLFAGSSNRWVKLVFLLLSPVWLLFSAVQLFSMEQAWALIPLVRLNLPATAILAVLLLPYVGMYLRLRAMFNGGNIKHSPLGATITPVLFGATALACLLIIAIPDTMTQRPRQVHMEFERSTDSGSLFQVRLSEPGPEASEVFLSAPYLDSQSGLPIVSLRGDAVDGRAGLESSSSSFLNRRTYNMVLELPPATIEASVRIAGDTGLIVYDSSLPFSIDASTGEIVLLLGAIPARPEGVALPLEIVLPRTANVTLNLELVRQLGTSSLPALREGLAVNARLREQASWVLD